MLHQEQPDQDRDRDRHDVRFERRCRHLQPLNRAEHRYGRGDDAVAVEQRGANHREHDRQPLPSSTRAQTTQGKRRKGKDAALALIVRPHDDGDVLERDDDEQGPEDERKHAEDGRFVERQPTEAERLAHGVERARADVAVDDADRTDDQDRQPAPRRTGSSVIAWGSHGGGLALIGDARRAVLPVPGAARKRAKLFTAQAPFGEVRSQFIPNSPSAVACRKRSMPSFSSSQLARERERVDAKERSVVTRPDQCSNRDTTRGLQGRAASSRASRSSNVLSSTSVPIGLPPFPDVLSGSPMLRWNAGWSKAARALGSPA